MMANLGMADTLILMVLALVVFGPRRLPQIGRQIGKLMYEFRKASNDFKFQMEEELRLAEEADRRKKEEEERQRALAAAPPPAQIEQSNGPAAESPIAAPYPEGPAAAVDSPTVAVESEPSTGSGVPAAAPVPAPAASSATESPYAHETIYFQANATAGEQVFTQAGAEIGGESRTRPVPGSLAEPASAVTPNPPTPHEAVLPRIQPPSTGEKVAADRPGALPQQQALDFSSTTDPDNAGKGIAQEAERSEPAAHHG